MLGLQAESPWFRWEGAARHDSDTCPISPGKVVGTSDQHRMGTRPMTVFPGCCFSAKIIKYKSRKSKLKNEAKSEKNRGEIDR